MHWLQTLKGKILTIIGFIVMALLVTELLTFIQIRKQEIQISETVETTLRFTEKDIVLVKLLKDIKLDVVQVQQWLTDISATRARKGFDDGFDEAEKYAKELRENVTKAQGLAKELGLDQLHTELGNMLANFGPFYETGKRMAQAYIDKGAKGGNKMMSEFDEVAESLGTSLDNLTALVEDFSHQSIEGLQSSMTEAKALSHTILIVVSSAVLGVTLMALIGMVLASRGFRPLKSALEVITEIANGNLDTAIETHYGGEVGLLLSATKTMQSNLKERIETDAKVAAEMARIKTALDNVSGNVMVADAQGKVIYLNKAVSTMFRNAEQALQSAVPGFGVEALMGTDLDRLYEDLARENARLSQVGSTQSAEFEVGGRTFRTVVNPVFDDNGERLGTAVEWTDRTTEVTVEYEVQDIVEYAQAGDLSQRIDLAGKSGFFEKLSQSLNALLEVSERVINDTLRVLGAMSGGDLTETISADYEGTFGQLKRDANATVVKLTEVIGKIKMGAESVSSGSQEISQGNTNLSQRTEEQAANLEETASSMEQMTATVKQNADNARQANQLASGAREQADKGGQVVGKAVSAMGEINAASKRIADIIGVIDEIAFQTNLLALNAAVEAARAGEQGRGFAVVASEVRNLAQRSATAAKEIKALIVDSVDKVEQGSQLVDQSGQTLEEIVTSVKKVSDIVAEIAAASTEQSSGIEQVNKAIMQMDDVTQQNAALVEQAAAASESMDEQARNMKGLMEFFTVDEQAVATVTRASGGGAHIDFSMARSKHLRWQSQLRRFLDGEGTLSKDQVVSHEHCELGKWLYSGGRRQYGHLQEMQQLEQVHKQLHERIRRVVDLKHAGKSEQADREFQQFEPLSQQVVSLLDAIERHVEKDTSQSTIQASSPRVEQRSANRPWTNPQSKAKPESSLRRVATGGSDGSEWEEF